MEPAYLRSVYSKLTKEIDTNGVSHESLPSTRVDDPAAGVNLPDKPKHAPAHRRESTDFREYVDQHFRVIEDTLAKMSSQLVKQERSMEDIARLLIEIRNTVIPGKDIAVSNEQIPAKSVFVCKMGDEEVGTTEKTDTEISFILSIPRHGDILVSDSSFHNIDCSDDEPYTFSVQGGNIEGKFDKRGEKYYFCLEETTNYPVKFGFKLKL